MTSPRIVLPLAAVVAGTLITVSAASAAESARQALRRDPVAFIASKFTELDKDGNGQLSGDELNAHPLLRLLDTDGSGGVTLSEAQAAIATLAAARGGRGMGSLPPAPAGSVNEDSPRQGPAILKPADNLVGSRLSDLFFTDLEQKKRDLWASAGQKGLVVALVGPDCPVSKRYLPTLARLSAEWTGRGFGFVVLAPLTDSASALKSALEGAGLKVIAGLDPDGSLARALGARVSTDAFLYDAGRTLVYRGAIDDQYGLGYQHDAPRREFLVDAMKAVEAAVAPVIAATEAPGCVLDLSTAIAPQTAAVTYHNRVSRIIQANCQECHRAGGIAPFALETPEQVSAKVGMIARMVSRDLMPPWFASAPAEGQHSPWGNDRSLSPRDKTDLLGWLEGGKPLGDPKDAPLPRTWPVEWQIGKPDFVAQIPNPVDVKATGTMRYQYAGVDLGLKEDKWVRGIEVQPTAREVVHHVLVFVQEPGKPLRHNGEAGGFFAAYVPGSAGTIYPEGFAKPLPAGSKLIFQLHYTPNGTATRDQVRIGLLFANEAPRHEVRVIGISTHKLNIPPGADNYSQSAEIPVPRPVRLLSLMPHMHVRGKAFRYEALLPDGSAKTLLDVPRYDFNWQLAYRYAEPLSLPPGSRVKVTGWFDNSAGNPANPDPTQTVRWGEQTTDEMLIGYAEYYFTDEDARLSKK